MAFQPGQRGVNARNWPQIARDPCSGIADAAGGGLIGQPLQILLQINGMSPQHGRSGHIAQGNSSHTYISSSFCIISPMVEITLALAA